jgi:hypothetical protein
MRELPLLMGFLYTIRNDPPICMCMFLFTFPILLMITLLLAFGMGKYIILFN